MCGFNFPSRDCRGPAGRPLVLGVLFLALAAGSAFADETVYELRNAGALSLATVTLQGSYHKSGETYYTSPAAPPPLLRVQLSYNAGGPLYCQYYLEISKDGSVILSRPQANPLDVAVAAGGTITYKLYGACGRMVTFGLVASGSFSVAVDGAFPTAPGVPSASSVGETPPVAGGRYLRTNGSSRTFLLSWPAAYDAGSGVAGYNVSGLGSTSETSLQFDAPPADGRYDYSIAAVDNVGNVGPASTIALIVDNSGPQAADLAAPGVITVAPEASDRARLTVSWGPAADLPSTYDPAVSRSSGLNRYLVRIGTQTQTVLPGQATTAAFSGLARGTTYELSVTAYDNLENSTVAKAAVVTPPRPAGFADIQANRTTATANGEPRYRNTVVFDQGPAFFQSAGVTETVDRFEILRSLTESPPPADTDPGIPLRSFTPAEAVQWTLSGGSVSHTESDGESLVGRQYAHRTLFYRLKTVYRNGYVEYSPVRPAALANYDTPFRVLAAAHPAEAEVVEMTEYTSSGPELYTNDAAGCRLRIEPGSDIEGDSLGLSADYTPAGSAAPTGRVEASGGTITLDRLLGADGEGSVTLAVRETAGGFSGATHTSSFTVIYDTSPPQLEPTLALRSRSSPPILFDEARHTPAAAIEICGLAASDPAGAVHSGVTRLSIHNEAGGAPIGTPQAFAWNGSPITAPWSLDASGEGPKSVVVEATDRAGNVGRRALTTTYDATPPAAPVVPFHDSPRYDQHSDAITLSWAPFTDNLTAGEDLSYEVTLNGVPLATQRGTSCEIAAASSYGPNTALLLAVKAVDRAGNRSSEASPSGLYAPAKVGTLAATVVLGYAGNHSYSLTWRIAEASRGAGELLRVSWSSPSGQLSTRELSAAGDSFALGEVPPHRSLSYQLVALNSCGFETAQFEGPPSTWQGYTVPNSPPARPRPVAPQGLSTLAPLFSWAIEGNEADRDGDSVAYTLLCRRAGASGWPASSRATSNGSAIDAADYPQAFAGLLADEVSVEWMVVATDPFGGIGESEIASFSVDGRPPEVTIERITTIGNLFTSTRSLTARARDANGIASVTYTCDDLRGETGAPLVQPATLSREGGETIALVPLHESLHSAADGRGVAYTLTVTAYDGAGNAAAALLGPIGVDWSPPAAPELTLAAPLYAGRPVCFTGKVPILLTAGDDYSGLREIQYGFVDSAAESPDGWRSLPLGPFDPSGSAGAAAYSRLLEAGERSIDGRAYYLVIRLADWAGNTGEPVVAHRSILFDGSPPLAEVEVGGTAASAGRLYLASPAALVITPVFSDPDTGATADYALVDETGSAGEPAWKPSAGELLAGLEPGRTYAVALRATNGVGVHAAASSRPFTYDPTPPAAFSLGGAGLAGLVSGETVRVRAEATDPESGISRFRLAIGSSAGGLEVSSRIAGNLDGWLMEEAQGGGAEFVVVLPELADGSYLVRLEATNGAGLTAGNSGAEALLTVDNSRERLIVIGQGAFSASPDTLRASWLYHGSAKPAGYRYRILASDGSAARDWTATDALWAVASGLHLAHGASYHFEVEALFSDRTAIRASGAEVRIDITPPQFAAQGGLTLPSACTSRGLRIGWSIADAESGIRSLEALLSTYDGSVRRTIPLPSTEAVDGLLLATDAEGRPLPLATGELILVTLRVTNGAGASVERQAPAVMVDDTPPPAPVVVDQGEVINTSQHLAAQWLWTERDPESGTLSYRWAIVADPAAIAAVDWHECSSEHSVDLAAAGGIDDTPLRRDKAQWYFAVEATNGSGLRSVGFSDGIVYDATAPLVIAVRLIAPGGDPKESPDLRYLASLSEVALYVEAVEDVQQKLIFTVRSGSLEGGTFHADPAVPPIVSTEKTIPLGDPSLVVPGRITLFRVECTNEAGLVSQYGYTKGVLLDSTPPRIEAVRGRMSENGLFFDWDCAAGIVPITGYLVALLPASQASQGPGLWKEMGTNRTLSFDRERDGIDAGSYLLFVKARNAAGLESPVARSGVVSFDLSPPRLASLATPRYASQAVALTATAEDAESGIGGYQYEVGSFEDLSAFSGGWIDLLSNATRLAESIEPAGIPDGCSLRITLRVRNGAGLWSDLAVSAPVTIDRTPPARPAVTASPFTTDRSRIEGIAYSAADPQSGIRALRLAAVAAIGEAVPPQARLLEVGDDAHFVSPANSEAFTLDGLALAEAGRYFLAAQAQNGAGDWSAVGYSEALLVDTIAPTLTFAAGALVVNAGPAMLAVNLSERARVAVSIVAEGGTVAELTPFEAEAGESSFEFPMSEEGGYLVFATPADPAGNTAPAASRLAVRINAAPRISFGELLTAPGQPLGLFGNAFDPDGDYPLRFSWSFGDGSPGSEEAEPVHVYHHRSMSDQSSRYSLTLTVTDSLGKSATTGAFVTVRNTVAGSLYADEEWSGERTLLGDVVVPVGRTLTVLPGAAVSIAGNYRIVIEGSLTVESGTSFLPASPAQPGWKGIVVSGRAAISGSTIASAERGVAALPGSQVTIGSTVFTGNQIGVHACGSRPAATDSRFEASAHYGVKEDEGGEPLVTGCVFGGNLYDYYDEVETVIGVERLNELGSNGGNSHE